jgi:hypothetical protein
MNVPDGLEMVRLNDFASAISCRNALLMFADGQPSAIEMPAMVVLFPGVEE